MKDKSVVSLKCMSCEFLIKPQIQCCDERSSTHIQTILSIKANKHVPHKMAQLTHEDKEQSQALNELPVTCNKLLKCLLMLNVKQDSPR